jgi:thiol:disulfide interchange protein DsbD
MPSRQVAEGLIARGYGHGWIAAFAGRTSACMANYAISAPGRRSAGERQRRSAVEAMAARARELAPIDSPMPMMPMPAAPLHSRFASPPRWSRWAAWLVLPLLAWTMTAQAFDERDLLPVDQAFVVSASAPSRDRVVVRWQIADGYYLYQERMGVQAGDGDVAVAAVRLPTGTPKHDEFFGDVHTYRGVVQAEVPIRAAAGATRATLKVKYQGCADLGICYPPQLRTLQVALPVAASAAAGDVLAGLGPAAAAPVPGGGLLAGLGGNATTALPETAAFGVEAIALDGASLLVRFEPARGYYLYRDKIHLRVKTADGRSLAVRTPAWPPATAWHDAHFGDVQVYLAPFEVRWPLQPLVHPALPVQVEVELQGCEKDGICYPPMTRRFAITLPALDAAAVAKATHASTATAVAPPATPTADQTVATGGTSAAGQAGPGAQDAGAATTNPAGTHALPAPVAQAAGTPANPATVAATAAKRAGGALGLLGALLLALLGGVILNLMPCVLPVLSLKLLSLVGKPSLAAARRHALAYTVGVLLSMLALGGLALALRATGAALGWGFQLQQPWVVAVLALVMLALGLSLAGVWQFGGRWAGMGQGLTERAGLSGDFFTGVLAVVVATPCTAPFMGAALAWAFAAPWWLALGVFLALGLGLALPFLLAAWIPAIATRLPRPGAWMDTLKQLLAFPLYLTAVWLLWLLVRQRGADAVLWWGLAAVLLAFALWWWTRAHRAAARVAAVLALVLVAWPVLRVQQLPAPGTARDASRDVGDTRAIPFSEARLQALRTAGTPVLLDFTADWCVSCKANERAVFAREQFREDLSRLGVVFMVGDWTDVDPEIGGFLQRHGAVGVPFTIVYPRGGGEGTVLPALLTPGLVHDAMVAAAGSPATP